MCGPHWRHVPRGIQALVYRNYRAGQCDDGNVTAEWHAAADLAIAWVAHKEGRISTDTRDRIAAKARGVLAPSRGHS